MNQVVSLGFLGCGNIGGGVWHLLREMHEELLRREGLDLQVKRALVKSIPEARTDVPVEILTERAEDVLEDPEISIVCEFMGGEQPAARFMLRALEQGKTVVTANKMALALHWGELQAAAEAHGARLLFEASVGGVIPVIRSLSVSLAADRMDTVMGIVNGTTNYILTRMSQEGCSYAEALQEAQRLGLAEPNPTADVGGYDAAYKLSILSTLAFHSHVPFEKVYREGIEQLTAADIACGREMGYTLKLLAIGKLQNGTVEARVHPTFLPDSHPLARVDGSLNAIFLHGGYCQDMMLQGRGAGDKPTASAICGDILCAARCAGSLAPKPAREETGLRFADDWVSRYLLRVNAADEPGVLARLADALGREGISLASVLQKGAEGGRASVVIITHEAGERALRRALEGLDAGLFRVESVIRVEG